MHGKYKSNKPDKKCQHVKIQASIGRKQKEKISSSKYVGRLQNKTSDKKGGNDTSKRSIISQNCLKSSGISKGNVTWNSRACERHSIRCKHSVGMKKYSDMKQGIDSRLGGTKWLFWLCSEALVRYKESDCRGRHRCIRLQLL